MKIIFDTFEINIVDPKIEQKIAQCLFSANQKVDTKEKPIKEKKTKPKNTFQPWTNEEEAQILDFLAQGKSYKQISILLERPINAIYQRKYKIIAERKQTSSPLQLKDAIQPQTERRVNQLLPPL